MKEINLKYVMRIETRMLFQTVRKNFTFGNKIESIRSKNVIFIQLLYRRSYAYICICQTPTYTLDKITTFFFKNTIRFVEIIVLIF